MDYNGKETFENYRQNPPKTKSEEIEFVKRNTPKMVNGIGALKRYVEYIKSN